MSFGTNIGYLRKKKGMTQEEFAERMFVSRQTVSRWETDSVYPDVETVIKLCELLECDMETLVRGDATLETQPPSPEVPEKKQIKCKAEMELDVDWVLLVPAISSLIFILAIAAYLVMGFAWSLWHPGWVIFVVAAMLCGAACVVCNMLLPALFSKREQDEQNE